MDILYRGDNEELWFADGLVFTDSKGRKARLVADCIGEFDIAFCQRLYAVYENDEHELVLLERGEEGWTKTVILKSRSGEMKIFGLRLIVSEERLNIIYGLNHNGRRLIIHQLPGGEPQVIDEAYSERLFVCRDEAGCIYSICESRPELWTFCVCRMGNWSKPEEFLSGGLLLDVMVTDYKEFCTVSEKDGVSSCKRGKDEFAISGKNPSLVRYNGEFVVLSEDNGRISYTGKSGKQDLITASQVRQFRLRIKDSGEYALCQVCRGSIIKGRPRLFLIDNKKAPDEGVRDSVRLEMTKRSIKLETRLSLLEQRLETVEKQLFNLCNPQ